MRRALSVLIGAAVLTTAGVLFAGDGDPDGLRARADAELAKKNYETALELYGRLTPKAGSADARAVGVRQLRCLWWLRRHDEVIAAAKALVEQGGASPESLEAHVRAGSVCLDRPHWGTELRGKFYRGEWKRGGQWVNRNAEDLAEGERWLRAGRAVATPLLAQESVAKAVRELAITGQVELVRAIWAQHSSETAPDAPGPLPPSATPGKAATPLQEGAWLLRDVARIDTATPQEYAARALYQLAAHCRQVGDEHKGWQAEPRFREVSKRYAGTAAALESQYALGVLLEESNRFREALTAWQPVAEQQTSKRWRVAAQRRMDLTTRPQLGLRLPPPVMPGAAVEFALNFRNIEVAECSAWKIDLPAWHRRGLDALARALQAAPAKDGGLPRFGTPHARWSVATGDRGDHVPGEFKGTAPIPGPGAWVVQARGGGLTSSGICLVTDLSLIVSASREQVLCYAAASADGVPQAGVSMQVIERWNENRTRRQNESSGTSDDNGGWVGGRVRPRGGSYVTAVAMQGDRVAATSNMWSWRSGSSARQVTGYVETDRPVYRPGHEVKAKITLRHGLGGDWSVPSFGQVWLQVIDPKGGKLIDAAHPVDDDGIVDFSVGLGTRAVLGSYRLYLREGHAKGRRLASGRFRVEEYRRPEIEVTVEAGDVAKLGDEVEAKVVAAYYFGGGVPNADVKWRVSRRFVRPRRVSPGPWDWLYGTNYGLPRMGGPREGYEEVVASGAGKTAADGTLTVKVPTTRGEGDLQDYDQELVVWAEVTDASRRTIEGRGTVRASRRAVNLFVQAERGFARSGETVTCRIAAETPAGRQADAAGVVYLERLVRADDAKPDTPPTVTAIEQQPFTLNAADVATTKVSFVVDAPGEYRVRAVAPDAWDTQTDGAASVTVIGEGTAGSDYRYGDLTLTTDQRTYQEGQTAGVVARSPFRGGAVLLTEVVDDRLLSWRVLPLTGRTAEAKFALTREHVPNAYVIGRLIHGGEVRMARAELLVPPHDRMLKVEVTAEHEEYRPGETAKVTVRATLPDGAPAAGVPVSLGVVDKSLFYIQPEQSPDVRRFYYGSRRGDSIRRSHSLGFAHAGWHADHSGRPQARGGRRPSSWWGWEWNAHRRGKGGLRLGDDGEEGGESENSEDFEEEDALSDKDGGPAMSGGAVGGRAAAPGAPRKAAKKSKNEERERKDGKPNAADGADAQAGGGDAPKIRSNFSETAFWSPSVRTKRDGTAEVEVTMPDSVTAWRLMARGITRRTEVGSGEGTVRTRKPLVVRLAAPRFLIERDAVVLSVSAVSQLSTPTEVEFTLTAEGESLAPFANAVQTLTVPANGEVRADFRTTAVKFGAVRLIASVKGGGESDAMARTLPVRRHGVRQERTSAAMIRGAGTRSHTVAVPTERDPAASVVEVAMTPTLGGVLLEGLPYLIDYPYGCVEQTMSRFLPAVQVSRTLQELGLDLKEVARKRSTLDPAQLPDRGRAGAVFSEADLKAVTAAGVARLADMQHGDGGWGWWHAGASDPYMSAYVLHGLLEARDADVTLPRNMIKRGLQFLAGVLEELDVNDVNDANGGNGRGVSGNLNQHVLASYVLARGGMVEAAKLDKVWTDREELSIYGKALLVLALHLGGKPKQATIAWENLAERIETNAQSGTAFVPVAKRHWWRWWNDRVETTAWSLRAFLAVNPDDTRTSGLARWLVNNRQGGRWRSTKDTALAIGALTRYMKRDRELDCDLTVTVQINGVAQPPVHFTRDNALDGTARVHLAGTQVPGGDNQVTVTTTGRGNCYYTVSARYFTMEEDIPATGYELHVDRKYFKLTPREVERHGRTVLEYDRAELKTGDAVVSGDRIEVVCAIKADNDYDYVALENRKPAGFEPIEIRSGSGSGPESHREFRDERVVMFFTHLPQGVTEVAYQVRAEAPGTFHGLPAQAYAMYAPRATGTSTEHRVTVQDKKQ